MLSAHRLDVGGRLGGSLEKDQSVLLCEELTLLGTHGSPVLQIALVSNKHDCHVRVAVLTSFLKPPAKVVKAFPSRDVINKQRTCSIAVIGSRDGSKGFLSGLIFKDHNNKKELRKGVWQCVRSPYPISATLFDVVRC